MGEDHNDDLVLQGTKDEFAFDVVFTSDTDEETISVINCELDDQDAFFEWKERVLAGNY